MSATPAAIRSRWLAPLEYTFLGVVIFSWAVFVVALGKDMSWDFRNYHWYIPYAFLHGRMNFDVAVSHQATYYNPILDIPFYLLARHAPSWFALGALGAVQGANIVPLYFLARTLLRVRHREIAAGALALFCATGSLTVSLAGQTYYDNILSLLILGALAIIVCNREVLRDGPVAHALWTSGVAGLAVGAAIGLKLPEGLYAFGFAAALAVLPGTFARRLARLAAGAAGGLAGIGLFAGYWFFKMFHETGNPLFPYYNQYFRSPLALETSYRDTRFVPHRWPKRLLFPILFSMHWQVANDLPFHDIRVGGAYVVGILTAPLAFFRRRDSFVDPVVAGALFAFAGVSYAIWIFAFGIYRYIVALEMLAPILIVGAIGLWPVGKYFQAVATGMALAGILLTTHYEILERAPLGDPYVQVALPPIRDPQHSLILMTGEAPMGYLLPELPPAIPVLRIDGWMIQPHDGSKMTAATRARVDAYKGDLYVIANEYEVGRAGDALAEYGLGMRWTECNLFTTNLGGPYRFCPLKHLPAKRA
ncbi:MAG: hypothetical protein JO056_09035 [Alphaproteobacteria bacterium]|nr:hypothetical protein [Alphaproteobacteria bacterium]